MEARTAELRRALDELRHPQAALIQGERLATIGELVAGVAHEIYNPFNAIAGAAVPIVDLVEVVREVLAAHRAMEPELSPERQRALEELRARVDMDASREDLVGISLVIKRATERSVRNVQNLRNFSRVSGEPVPADLHVGLAAFFRVKPAARRSVRTLKTTRKRISASNSVVSDMGNDARAGRPPCPRQEADQGVTSGARRRGRPPGVVAAVAVAALAAFTGRADSTAFTDRRRGAGAGEAENVAAAPRLTVALER